MRKYFLAVALTLFPNLARCSLNQSFVLINIQSMLHYLFDVLEQHSYALVFVQDINT